MQPEVADVVTKTLWVTLVDGSDHALKLSSGKSAHTAMHEFMFDEPASEMSRKWLACESGASVLRDAIVSVRVESSDPQAQFALGG